MHYRKIGRAFSWFGRPRLRRAGHVGERPVALVWLQTQYPNEFVGFGAAENEPPIRAGRQRRAYRIHGRAKQVPKAFPLHPRPLFVRQNEPNSRRIEGAITRNVAVSSSQFPPIFTGNWGCSPTELGLAQARKRAVWSVLDAALAFNDSSPGDRSGLPAAEKSRQAAVVQPELRHGPCLLSGGNQRALHLRLVGRD